MVLFYKVWLIPSFHKKTKQSHISSEHAIERMKGSGMQPEVQRCSRIWYSESLHSKEILWNGWSFETRPHATLSAFSVKCCSKHEQWPKLCASCTLTLWYTGRYLA